MSDANAGSNEAWTVQRLLDWTRGHFERRELDAPRLAAEILLAKALGWKRIELYARFDAIPKSPELDVFREMVKRAADHEPIAYLVGTKEFYSLEFEVSSAVLIPRPETETLVQQSIEWLGAAELEAPIALDWCTGSGCIAIALLKNVAVLNVVASDISAEALEVASRNGEKHAVSDRLTLIEADRLALPATRLPEGGFNLIAANPPYVAESEMPTLDANVRDYEPSGALCDNGDGLSFYRELAEKGGALLASGGTVIVEVGDTQAEAVRAIFTAANGWTHRATWRDPMGRHERIIAFDGPR